MGQLERRADPSTIWLADLVAAMERISASTDEPEAADRQGLYKRLQLPALVATPVLEAAQTLPRAVRR